MDEEQDEGMWGDIDSIRLLDADTNLPEGSVVYESWEDAVDYWTPGQAFHFVVRQVPARLRKLSVEELLKAIDPDGSVRAEIEKDKENPGSE